MAVSNKKRKAILRGYPEKGIEELARELKLSEHEVKSLLREEGEVASRSYKIPLMVAASFLLVLGTGAGAYWFLTSSGARMLSRLTGAMNVLLVTIDTCRADHIGCYGYSKARTPVIDAVAASGVRFDKAFAHQPITLPSHTTILTGTHSAHHGVLDNGLYRLPDKAVTLAEVVKEEGMATGAVIAAFILHHQYGLDQGFDLYDDRLLTNRRSSSLIDQMDATSVSDRAIDYIDKNKDRRWFLWLHYYDPHYGFDPPKQFKAPGYHPYDGEIAYVDFELGRVIEALEQRRLREKTLLVITADHGESLGEHDYDSHCLYLYDSIMHVPLIVSLPGTIPAGRVSKKLVGLVDVAPTIIDALGMPPLADAQGISLVPLFHSEAEDWPERSVLMETHAPWNQHGWSPSFAIRAQSFKFIKSPKPELYDVESDPAEMKNIFANNPGRAASMARELNKTRADHGRPSLASASYFKLEEHTRERLESLGYVFTGGQEPKRPSDDAPDTKDMIDTMNLTAKAWDLKKAGRIEDGLAILEEILVRSPKDRRVLNKVGMWYTQLKNYAKAEEAFKRLIEVDPEFIEAYLNLGYVYVMVNQLDKADNMARTMLALNPESAKAYNLLAYTYLTKGDYDNTVSYCRKALEIFPTYDKAYDNLGMAYYRLGDFEKARQAYSAALEIMPDSSKYKQKIKAVEKKM